MLLIHMHIYRFIEHISNNNQRLHKFACYSSMYTCTQLFEYVHFNVHLIDIKYHKISYQCILCNIAK